MGVCLCARGQGVFVCVSGITSLQELKKPKQNRLMQIECKLNTNEKRLQFWIEECNF